MIRIFAGAEASYVYGGGGTISVQIVEIFTDASGARTPGQIAQYTFMGGGLSIGLKAGLTMPSGWKEFSLPVPATADDFWGSGQIFSGPGVSLVLVSINSGLFLRFDNPPPGVTIYLNTSGTGRYSGFGATAVSAYAGYWKWSRPFPIDFSGS
jgi:hypothetical protein